MSLTIRSITSTKQITQAEHTIFYITGPRHSDLLGYSFRKERVFCHRRSSQARDALPKNPLGWSLKGGERGTDCRQTGYWSERVQRRFLCFSFSVRRDVFQRDGGNSGESSSDSARRLRAMEAFWSR